MDADGFPVLEDVILVNDSGEGVRLRAIIDTGAANCYIKKSIIDFLKLKSVGDSVYVNPVGGNISTGLYPCGVVIQDFNFGHFLFRHLPSDSFPSDVILGVEFLSNNTFEYFGKDGYFRLTHSHERLK